MHVFMKFILCVWNKYFYSSQPVYVPPTCLGTGFLLECALQKLETYCCIALQTAGFLTNHTMVSYTVKLVVTYVHGFLGLISGIEWASVMGKGRVI